MMKPIFFFVFASLAAYGCAGQQSVTTDPSQQQFIRVSSRDHRYFETSGGHTWVPVMINFILPNGEEEKVFEKVEMYFRSFSANGGNAMRIWISSPFLEIEDQRQGEYDPVKFRRIDRLLQLAEKYHIRIKFTLQHMRSISPQKGKNSWSNNTVLAVGNGGTFRNIRQYINSTEGKTNYLNRARALAEKYRNNPSVFGWELWNEMDAVDATDWYPFTAEILDSVKKLFPNQLVTQTLGSLHSDDAEKRYRVFFGLANNEYVSLHRYIDPGKDWHQYDKITQPVDLLVADAVQFAERNVHDRPVLVNEIGAVEANHRGPSLMYAVDSAGVLIHDMIFAPFFCGAAGSGSLWHWDAYVQRQQLWPHYRRFLNAIQGIDPAAEHFQPFSVSQSGMRAYGLKGKTQTILWLRDTANNWKTELMDHEPAIIRKKLSWKLPDSKQYRQARVYDPWKDAWSAVAIKHGRIIMPDFTRSVILVLK